MRRQDGSLIGEKGVRYGLQKPGVQQSRRPAAPAAPAAPRPVNVFGDDESDEDVETQVARQAEKKRSAAKVQQTYEDALAQDPSVFDYDGVYDTIQESRTLPKQQEKIERKSRYIAQLKEQADHRKREEEVRFERRLMKERQQEDHLYEGKDKFITSAYRKKLEEDKKWVEDQKQKEAEEEANDVRKIGHMGNFYANLLTKNVALGNAAAKPKQSEEQQAASHRDQDKQEGASQREGSSGRGSEEPQAGTSQQGKGAEKDAGKEKDTEKEMAAAAAAALQKKRQQQQQPVDKYEAARMEAELALREQRESGARQPAEQGEKAQSPAASDRRDQPAAPSSASPPAQAPRKPEAEGAKPAAGQPAALAGGKRRNDDSAVMGARERYLARKKQLTGS